MCRAGDLLRRTGRPSPRDHTYRGFIRLIRLYYWNLERLTGLSWLYRYFDNPRLWGYEHIMYERNIYLDTDKSEWHPQIRETYYRDQRIVTWIRLWLRRAQTRVRRNQEVRLNHYLFMPGAIGYVSAQAEFEAQQGNRTARSSRAANRSARRYSPY